MSADFDPMKMPSARVVRDFAADLGEKLCEKVRPKCPICSKKMPPKTAICCPDCWWALNANDRTGLATLHRMRNHSGLASKLAAIVRRVMAAGVSEPAAGIMRAQKLLDTAKPFTTEEIRKLKGVAP